MAKKKKKKTALAAALEKTAKKAAKNKKANKQKKQAVQKKVEPKKAETKKPTTKKGSVVLSDKTKARKDATKDIGDNFKKAINLQKEEKYKSKETNKYKAAIDTAQHTSALGTKVEKKTGTVKVKGKNGKTKKVTYEYEPMTMQDYGKQEVAAMTGQHRTLMKTDKELNKKVADLNVKDYAESPGVMGALDQLTQGLSVSEDPLYNYSKSQKKIMNSQKQTGKYMAGRMAGAVAEFGLGGTGTLGSSLGKTFLKTTGKEALKEAAEQSGKQLAKVTAKNIAKDTFANAGASLPLNILDSIKFSYKDGKYDKDILKRELAFNVGGDLLIGGVVSGITHGLSARQVANFNKISKKKAKGEAISEAEQKFYDKHVKDVTDKVEARLKQLKEEDAKKNPQATKPSDAVEKAVENPVKQVAKATDEATVKAEQPQEVKVEQPQMEEPTVAKSATTEQPKVEEAVEQPTPQTTKVDETTNPLTTQVDEMRKAGRTDDEIIEELQKQGVPPYKAVEAVDGGIDDGLEAVAKADAETPTVPKVETKAKPKKPTASDVRAAFENQKKGNFTVSEDDMQFAETLWKSDSCTDDVLRGELKEDVEKGLFGKTKDISNDEALEVGKQKVQQDAKGETEIFVNKVEEGQKLKKQDFATATELLVHYKNTGDVANWKKVALAMAKGYSDAGQILQSARMVRRLSPEGRATQVLKLAETIKKDFAKNRGKNIEIEVKDETIERVLNATDEAELNEAFKQARVEIWNQVPASFMEKLQALQRMSMLGNPKTMIRNVAGNFIFKPFRAISGTFETGFQKMGTKQLAKLDGGRTKKLVKPEDKEMYKGFKQTADEMFDDVYEQFGGSNSYAESYARPHEANIFDNNSGKVASALSEKIKGSTRISKSIKSALDYIEQKGMTQTAHNVIMGGLEKGDLLILKPEFKHSFAQFCYARGLNPSTMTKVQLEEAVEHAMNEAKYATFRNDSALASLISKKQGEWMTKKGATGLQTLGYRAGAGIIQTMIPFKKTPINIAKIGLDYSPLNIARGIYHNIEAVKRTGNADLLLQSYKEMASGLTGSAVFGLGMLLYSTGAVTVKAGNWSTDEWYDKDMGNQDYSLKIGDHTFSLSWCAPLNMPFIMGAAFQEYLDDKGHSLEAGLNMANGMVDSFLELSFAQSMKNFLTENETVEDYLVDLSVMPLQYASQLVPTMSSQFATVLDDWQRDTTSYADGTLAKAWHKELNKNINKIPVLREKLLQPKVDRFGKEVPSSVGDNIVTKSLATFLSTANIKEITMNADDRYLIDLLRETDDEETRKKIVPTTGSYWAGRVDNVKSTPEQRTKYQKTRGKEFQKLISEQRTAKYQDILTLEQKRSKVSKSKWAAVTLADANTYGYKYALKAEDKRSEGNDYESNTFADFKIFKAANPKKTAKDYFDAHYSMKVTNIHAGDNEPSTKGLALYKVGADDKTYIHFGVDIGKKKVFKNYLEKFGGSEDEYYYATNGIQKNAKDYNGGYANNVIKAMTLAEQNAPDRVYYAIGLLDRDSEQMNLGRGLLAEGITFADIASYKANTQAYNKDGKGDLKKEEAIAYVESLGLKSQRQKALIFATLSTAKNPFGSVGTYSTEGDVLGNVSSSSGSGSRRGSGRSGGKKSGNLPSWESYAKKYMAEQTAPKSPDRPKVEAYKNPVSWEDYVKNYIN